MAYFFLVFECQDKVLDAGLVDSALEVQHVNLFLLVPFGWLVVQLHKIVLVSLPVLFQVFLIDEFWLFCRVRQINLHFSWAFRAKNIAGVVNR